MNAAELKVAQEKLGYTDKEIAIQLNTPLSTYRKWKQGRRRVPGIVEVALLALPREIKAG